MDGEQWDRVAQAYSACRQRKNHEAAEILADLLGGMELLRENGRVNWQRLNVLIAEEREEQ